MKFLEGKKTFVGLGVLLIGAFGLSNYIAPDEWEQLIKLSFELVGLVVVIYGRIVAKPKA